MKGRSYSHIHNIPRQTNPKKLRRRMLQEGNPLQKHQELQRLTMTKGNYRLWMIPRY
jgi:hypothetical protein